MALTDSLRILITANGAQAEREFSKVGAAAKKNLGQAENATQRFGRQLTSAGVAMAVFGGVALVGLYKAAQAAQEEDLAIAKLNNSLANSPELAGASADAFLEQAAALQDVTTFTDDATIAAQAMLGTFHLTQDEILGLTPLVQDLASKFDIDLNRAAILVGKAMDGNAGALGRMGVNIDEAAFATDRFGAVMSALRENAGGFAEQEGATFNGQMTIMKNNLGDIAEGIGRGAVEAFNSLLGPVKAVSGAFERLNPETQSAIGKITTFGAAGLTAAGGISFLTGQVLTAVSRFNQLRTAMAAANASAVAAYGPWGALAVLFGLIATGAIDLTNAMTEQELDTGAIDAMTRAMIEAGDATEGLVGYMNAEWDPSFFEAAGVSAEEFAAALLSGETAWDAFVERVTGQLPEGADIGQWTDALEQHRDRAQESAEALGEQGRAAELAALGLDATATSAEELTAQMDALDAAMNAYLDTTLGLEAAQSDQQAGLDSLRDSLQENGQAWDINTEAGRANIAAGQDVVRQAAAVVSAARDEAEATGNYTAAQRTANGAMQTAIGELRQMKNDGLLSAAAYRTLRDRILGVPHGMPGAGAIISDLQLIYSAAINAANAIGQIGGSLAGGGSYSGGRSGGGRSGGGRSGGGRSRPTESGTAELGRSIARELQKGALPVVVVG